MNQAKPIQKYESGVSTMKESGVGQYVKLYDYRTLEGRVAELEAQVETFETHLDLFKESIALPFKQREDVLKAKTGPSVKASYVKELEAEVTKLRSYGAELERSSIPREDVKALVETLESIAAKHIEPDFAMFTHAHLVGMATEDLNIAREALENFKENHGDL